MISFILVSIINCKCNIENESGLSLETFISFSSLLIALAALYITLRLQLISFINTQILELTKTCNAYLQDDYQVHKNGKITQGRASGIVTALEDIEIAINNSCCGILIWKFDLEGFKKFAFIHLHSSIKEILKGNLEFNYEIPENNDVIRKYQLDKSRLFFRKEIDKKKADDINREMKLKIKR